MHVMGSAVPDGTGIGAYEVCRGATEVTEVPGAQHMVDVIRLRPSTVYAFTVRARDDRSVVSYDVCQGGVKIHSVGGSRAAAVVTGLRPGTRYVFTAATHRSGGAYSIDLSWDRPSVDEVVTEHQIRLDGATATSLVWGADPPPGRAHYSFCAGTDAGTAHRVRLRARLPDGTWAASRRNGR